MLVELQASAASSVPRSIGTEDKILKDKVAEYAAKKSRKAAAKLDEQQKDTTEGLRMTGIRSLPDVGWKLRSTPPG